MVLTLFISEDKRDEFAGTAWPFDSLLEHTNQGALAWMYVGLSPDTHPSQPIPRAPAPPATSAWAGRRPPLGGVGSWPLCGVPPGVLAQNLLPWSRTGRPQPRLTWAPSQSGLNCGPGRPRGEPGRQCPHRAPASPGLWGTWRGRPAARFLQGRGGKMVLEGLRASSGHKPEPPHRPAGRAVGWVGWGPGGEPWLLVSDSPH